ncbi:MAG: ORC1-type DNA replication protein [Candidatus Hodarchaeota archaeon]
MTESNTLDDIFDSFLEAPTIFARREVLSSSFVPDNLPHREQQIRELGQILASALRGATPSNIFVYGKTGTGKTAVIKYVLKGLSSRAGGRGFQLSTSYMNCRVVDSNYRLLANLCGDMKINVPFTGLPTDEVYSRFCNGLENQKGLFILVLDEVDALVKKSGNETLYNLTRINTTLTNARVSLIGISNDLRFKDYLSPRVLSSLSEEEIVFPPYTAQEINDILLERAKTGFQEGVLDPGVCSLIAAYAAREHGDARRAIDLLRVAGEICERKGANKVMEEDVKTAKATIETNSINQVIGTLPLQSKIVLTSAYLMNKNNNKITTGDLLTQYTSICKEIGIEALSQRRVSDLINELDMLGIINARVVSQGRHGRTKNISIAVPEADVQSALQPNRYLRAYVTE